MKHSCSIQRSATLHGLWALVLCLACASYGASAVLSGFEIVGSAQGLALTLKADAPFPLKVEQKAQGKKPGHSLLVVRCSNVIYGLEDFEFAAFPAACPVKRISVSESPAGNSIDLLFDFTQNIDNPVASKQKGNKWIILLSRSPAGTFTWDASRREPPAPMATTAPALKAEPVQAGMSQLRDITVLQRDRVKQMSFLFDKTTAMRLKRGQDKIVVLFVNAASGLPASRYTPPGEPAASIELKQVAHGGTMWLGVTISMGREPLEGALMQAFGDRLVIYTAADSLAGLSLWSAMHGQDLSFNFIKIPSFTVDYDGMKKKALTDMSRDVPMGKTFAVREELPKKTVMEPPSAEPVAPVRKETPAPVSSPSQKEPSPVRVMVIKDDVNLRSSPSSAGDNVIGRLRIGTIATRVEKKQGWVEIALTDRTGWISSAMVVDSAKAPKSVFDAIRKIDQQRLARENAAEEKAGREKAALEKAEQDRLAKEKLAQEREAQKKAALESQAATRDSAVRYAAAMQDSVQTAKALRAKKLVEYHVYGRDPFLPLSRDEDSPVPDVEELKLVGILYDAGDRIALFEDASSKAYALRENDPVQNGYLLRVQPDKVLFLINELGISRTYALKLSREKEQ